MALNDVTISLDLNQLLGGDIDTRRTRVYVKTNVTNGTLIDTSTGETRLGDERVTLEADGTGSFTTWGVGADGNPTSWQTSVVVEYPRAGSRDRATRTFGPYTITDADDGKMLAELEDQQAIPAEYQTAFTEQAQEYLDAQAAIAGIDDTDSAVGALLDDDLVGPLTRAAARGLVAGDIGTPGSDIETALSASTDARIAYRVPGSSAAFMDALAAGDQSVAVQLIGDSTGNDSTEWLYLSAEEIAAGHPEFTVRHRLWNDGATKYDAPTVLQTGTAGARYALLDGTTDAAAGAVGPCLLFLPDSTDLSITGDLDLRIKVDLDSYAPASAQTFAAKFGAGGNRSWRWEQGSTYMTFAWTANGSTELTNSGGSSTRCLVATNTVATPGTPIWFRVTLDVDNGAGGWTLTYYYSTDDGATWTALGSAITNNTAGPTSVYDSTYQVEVGGRSGTVLATGKFYEMQVRNGIDGPLAAPSLIDQWRPNPPVDIVGAPILDFYNASISGANLATWTGTRLTRATPPANQVLTFLSDSHNEGGAVGTDFTKQYDALLSTLRSRLPLSTFMVVNQNPKAVGGYFEREHEIRGRQLIGWGRANSLAVVDVQKAFRDDPRGLAVLLNVDGIHPSSAGSQLWRDTVLAALEQRQ